MPMNWKEFVVSDPEFLRGKPRLKQTGTPVRLVLGFLAAGRTFEKTMAEFPDLT